MPEPKFLYGTHYSNPSYVIGYLVRVKPEYMLRLQSGKLDHPDRIYFSVEKDWENCNSVSVNELIPEFYEDNIEFLCNFKNIKFGLNSKNESIDNVILVSDNGKVQIGNPYVKGAKVQGKVVAHGKGKKIIVFKMKPKKK